MCIERKVIAIKKLCVSFCCIILLLTACGPTDKDTVASDKAIACANKAIETAEKYLDYEVDYEEAKEVIDDLQSDMEYVSNLSKEDSNYFADFNIRTAIMKLSIDLISANSDGSDQTYSDIEEDIQDLKELIE